MTKINIDTQLDPLFFSDSFRTLTSFTTASRKLEIVQSAVLQANQPASYSSLLTAHCSLQV